MKIVFDPPFNRFNPYCSIIVNSLRDEHYNAYSLKESLLNFSLFLTIKIYHLNWYETISSYSNFFIKIFKLILLIISGKKIIWTLHNKSNHNGKFPLLSLIVTKLLLRFSSKIVIHSSKSYSILNSMGFKNFAKVCYIPHPNYIKYLASIENNVSNKIKSNFINTNLNLLFFGAISEYKNLELLIDVVNKLDFSISLFIVGKCSSINYLKSLNKLIYKNKNINIYPHYISDTELLPIIDSCDLVVLPYNIDSSLNSGSVIFTFSCSKSVICPKIGTVEDISNHTCLLSYEYSNYFSHFNELSNKILSAYKLKLSKPEVFNLWGKKLYNEMNQYYSPYLVSQKLIDLYKNLL